METKPHDSPGIPAPPPFALSTDLDPASEVDVDLEADDDQGDEEELARDTIPEGVEYLGTYESIEHYLRAMLDPEISTSIPWVMDCIDWKAVQDQWEADGSRLMIEAGHVYRLAIPEPDPCGPWMPTRGG